MAETSSSAGRSAATAEPAAPATRSRTTRPSARTSSPPCRRDDPLFVAENDPALAQLEVPKLLREYGLILENVDGSEDPTHKFVLRATSASLSLATTITHPAGSSLPPDPLGNSGDGAFAGTLNSFPTGATIQHFTKSLNRDENVDFVKPTPQELDLMETFMLQLGRTKDINLQSVSLSNADAEAGRADLPQRRLDHHRRRRQVRHLPQQRRRQLRERRRQPQLQHRHRAGAPPGPRADPVPVRRRLRPGGQRRRHLRRRHLQHAAAGRGRGHRSVVPQPRDQRFRGGGGLLLEQLLRGLAGRRPGHRRRADQPAAPGVRPGGGLPARAQRRLSTWTSPTSARWRRSRSRTARRSAVAAAAFSSA